MSESDLIPMTTCPYNKAHRLKVSRLPYHLMKCEKQYAYLGYKICFYNHSHSHDLAKTEFQSEMPADQYLDHTKSCPDRFNFNSKPQPFIYGHSDTSDVPYVTGEWDIEPEDSLNAFVPEDDGKIVPQQQPNVYDGLELLREHYTGAVLPPSLAAIGNSEEKQTKSVDVTTSTGSQSKPEPFGKVKQSKVLEAIDSASSVNSENPEDLVKLLNMTSLIDLEAPSEDTEGE